jgi:hypothetical protein
MNIPSIIPFPSKHQTPRSLFPSTFQLQLHPFKLPAAVASPGGGICCKTIITDRIPAAWFRVCLCSSLQTSEEANVKIRTFNNNTWGKSKSWQKQENMTAATPLFFRLSWLIFTFQDHRKTV